VSLVNEQLFAETQDLNQSLHISLDQRDIDHNSYDLADVAGSDTDAGLNDNVDQNELNDKIRNYTPWSIKTRHQTLLHNFAK